jgi:hypothetical protein
MNHMDLWDKVSKPPESALKKIGGGRLVGLTDINPQWRIKAVTEVYGLCGFGWKYTVDKKWIEPGVGVQMMAFVDISLYVCVDGKWSEAIPGHGGSQLIALESKGPYGSDEAYKMATTDALSVALKMLGVGSAVYEGRWDGSKYRDLPEAPQQRTGSGSASQGNSRPAATLATGTGTPAAIPSARAVNQTLAAQSVPQTNAERAVAGKITSTQYDQLKSLLSASGIPMKTWKLWLNDMYHFTGLAEITVDAFEGIKEAVEKTPAQITNYKPGANGREPGQ